MDFYGIHGAFNRFEANGIFLSMLGMTACLTKRPYTGCSTYEEFIREHQGQNRATCKVAEDPNCMACPRSRPGYEARLLSPLDSWTRLGQRLAKRDGGKSSLPGALGTTVGCFRADIGRSLVPRNRREF